MPGVTTSAARRADGNGAGFVPATISPEVLHRLDTRLRSATIVEDPRISRLATHLLDGGGRRLRPTLVLVCALAVGGRGGLTARVMDAAVAIELFHLASLCHDDVLDEAQLRRGLPSANALWGNERAVLGGDVLLSHAYRIAAELGPKELRRLAATSLDVCAGQVAECEQRFVCTRSISDYESSIRAKTAALLSLSCWLGAAVAGADDETAETLGNFGTEIGIAFQIVDDILDLYADSSLVGKTTGSDLREGVFTLPVLLAVGDDPSLADALKPGIDDHTIAEVRRRARATGADRRAVDYAVAHLHAAGAHLEAIDLEPEGRRALDGVARAVVEQLALLHPPTRRSL